MINVVFTDEFVKCYEKLPIVVQKKAERQGGVFRNDPFYPSLHTEKLEPKSEGLWSFRIDYQYRIVFRFLNGETALFLTVGPHQRIYKF
jgi:mRNA-degrading endonuclease RelE of RelBE toxin-antitoxin system